MKVIVRELAFADLEGIFNWIAKDSPINARSVAVRVLDAIENKIAIFPFIGRAGHIAGTREWVVPGLLHIIVYEVDTERDAITILNIVHGAQQR